MVVTDEKQRDVTDEQLMDVTHEQLIYVTDGQPRDVCSIQDSCHFSKALCKVCATQRRASQVQRPFL